LQAAREANEENAEGGGKALQRNNSRIGENAADGERKKQIAIMAQQLMQRVVKEIRK